MRGNGGEDRHGAGKLVIASVTSIQEVPEAGELASTARSCQKEWLQAGIQLASHHARASGILPDSFRASGHEEMSPPSLYGRPLL